MNQITMSEVFCESVKRHIVFCVIFWSVTVSYWPFLELCHLFITVLHLFLPRRVRNLVIKLVWLFKG